MADTPLPAAGVSVTPSTAAAGRLAGAALRAAHDALKADQPRLRARDAAAALGVSEAELVAIGDDVVALRPDWPAIIGALEPAGPLMALTRNEAIVHEKTGVYEKVSGGPKVGITLGADIDLRLFYSRWCFGYAVGLAGGDDVRPSLQFFDAQGTAVHKIFVVDGTDRAAFARIVAGFTDPERPLTPVIEAEPPAPAPRPDAEIDVQGFHEAWDAMQDVHEFHDMLRRFGLDRNRRQALRLATARRATPVGAETFERLITAASGSGLPIMIFVGNPGCIQIHTGPVVNLKTIGEWFNVLDPGFNLHVRSPQLAHGFVVRKPTRDGVVTSLEIFDSEDRLVVSLFGKRKPGEAEDPAWRDLVEGFAAEAAA